MSQWRGLCPSHAATWLATCVGVEKCYPVAGLWGILWPNTGRRSPLWAKNLLTSNRTRWSGSGRAEGRGQGKGKQENCPNLLWEFRRSWIGHRKWIYITQLVLKRLTNKNILILKCHAKAQQQYIWGLLCRISSVVVVVTNNAFFPPPPPTIDLLQTVY